MSPCIKLASLQVQIVSDSSGVFCGNNMQVAWKSIIKQNFGYGVVSGDTNYLPHSINSIKDDDIIDSLVKVPKD